MRDLTINSLFNEEGDKGSSSTSRDVVIVQNVTDNSSFGVKLDGTNYQLWQRLMKIHIQGIGKWGYVTSSTTKPSAGPKAEAWDTANTNVMGILLKAMTTEVMQLFANFDSPKAIWDSVAATYYDGSDFARIHELNTKAFKMTQSGQAVVTYYASLKTIWQELDNRHPNPMTCDTDITSYRVEQDKMRVHIFLGGLDSHFEGAKNELLRLTQPPTLEQAFAYIRKDEANKAAMKNLHTDVSSLTVQAKSSPPITLSPQIGNSQYRPRNQVSQSSQHYNRGPAQFNNQVTCNYCKNIGHYKSQCPKLMRINSNNSGWKGGNNNQKQGGNSAGTRT